MTNQDIAHLTQAIMDLKGQIERMSERQDEMLEDVKKIKEAVYNPDQGLYARLKELESWKETSTRLTWIIVTALAGLGTATLWNLLINQ